MTMLAILLPLLFAFATFASVLTIADAARRGWQAAQAIRNELALADAMAEAGPVPSAEVISFPRSHPAVAPACAVRPWLAAA